MVICEAFAKGAGGIVADPRKGLRDGPAFFYGIVNETRALFDRARADGRDWYYADNSYLDRGRQAFFRVTKNAFQITRTPVECNYARAKACGAASSDMREWRETGEHIVICEQSTAFMELCGYKGNWVEDVCWELNKYTQRPLRIRRWNRDKGKLAKTLRADLEGAWALVTHMSAAANEALLVGVPVFVTGECAALPMASGRSMLDLRDIERPVVQSTRARWVAGLATNQWSLEEMRNGTCWRDMKLLEEQNGKWF